MSSRAVAALWRHSAYTLFAIFFFLNFKVVVSSAQTTQPFLFAGTNDGTGRSSGFVTLLRNGTTGALSLLPNTNVTFKDVCNPSAMDPTGHFLFGACGEGIVMFTLDSTSGIVAETATSPYFASTSTGQSGVLVIPESSGQYVYLLKVKSALPPTPSLFTLDSFQIDPVTPSLVAVNSQSLSLNASWVDAAADPAQHGFFLLVNQSGGTGSPAALLYAISLDPLTGLATVPASGLNIGNNARSLAMSPSGNYLALGWGDVTGSVTVYQVSPTSLNLALVGILQLGLEDGGYGSYSFPDSLFFSPGGNLLYAPAPAPNFTGGPLPFVVIDPSRVALLATAPILPQDAYFLNGLPDPQAPFTYVGNSGPTIFGVSVFQVDLASGLPSQPAPISAPFFSQMWIAPLFVPTESGAQGIVGPNLGIAPDALTFGATTVGQSSPSQSIVLKSLGNQSTSLTSIQISGANAGDFGEADNCISSPVLPTNHTCTIAVTFTPAAAGTSQAALVITDNASGSPQQIPLTGTANPAPPPTPAVTLNPPSSLSFPGTSTQGIPTLPQNVVLTNSGNASLQISGTALNGANAGDFSLSSNTCSGAIAPGATCTVSVIFSPQAIGIRTTTLVFTDNASNSPQSVTISGTGAAAASFAAASNGGMSVSISAGQSAQFDLQAVPGSGFSGTLNFTCSGAPTGAACTVPTSVAVSNATATTFTVTVTTSGTAALLPPGMRPFSPLLTLQELIVLALLILAALCLIRLARTRTLSPRQYAEPWALPALLFACCLGACGGGGGTASTNPTPPSKVVVTPSGSYAITLTPLATPSGSTKQLPLDPISLQLTVK